jgi:hypothetical protein
MVKVYHRIKEKSQMTTKIIDIQEKTRELEQLFNSDDFNKLYLIPNASVHRVYLSAEVKGKLNFGNLHVTGYYSSLTNSYFIDAYGFTTNNINVFREAFKTAYDCANKLQELLDAN